MKKIAFFMMAFAFVNFCACSSIDVSVSQKIDVKGKFKKIAVFPFEVKGADWGDEFCDAISHQLFKSGRVEVVDRESIEKIIKEQKLNMSGLVDEEHAIKIGKLLGVDVIVIGRGSSLSEMDDGKPAPNLIDTFTLKALSVETGQLLFTVRKEPGSAWSGEYYAKFCCSFSLIWDRHDVLIESSKYDDIARQVVDKILCAMDEAEEMKTKK